MKVRSGFVSNSSSSSFILIVKKSDYDIFYNTLTDYEKEVIDYVSNFEKKFNNELVKLDWNEGDNSSFYDFGTDILDEEDNWKKIEDADNTMNKISSKLRKQFENIYQEIEN